MNIKILTEDSHSHGLIPRVARFREIAAGDVAASDSYAGIPIFAEKGLHAHAVDVMEQHGLLARGTRVLELACGAGAMSQRLGDRGLSVLALDALPEAFKARHPSVRNRFADLNGPFDVGLEKSFDLVVALEIIAHLESPRAFLRACFACLKPGGHLFLTTPNVDSSYAVLSLALNGTFARFDDNYLRQDGHIMPLVRHQFLAAASDCGFQPAMQQTFGKDSISLRAWPKFWALLQMVRRLRGGTASEGAIAEYILRRPG